MNSKSRQRPEPEVEQMYLLRKQEALNEEAKILQTKLEHLLLQVAKPGTLNESEECIYIRSKGRRQKVCFSDIVWIQSERNYVSIVTDNDQFSTLIPIGTIEQQLPAYMFGRVHKSFIVAFRKVDYALKNHISLKWDVDTKQIPLGAQYKKSFLAVLEQKTAKKSKSFDRIYPKE